MTLNDSSNTLRRKFSALGNKQQSEWVPCLSSQLFGYMKVHVISSAGWRHNPPAVTREFSLAQGQQTQRHHTAPAGRCCLFTLPLNPQVMTEHLLRWCFEFYGDFYFLWQRKTEHKRGLFGLLCHSWRQSFLIWVMLIRLPFWCLLQAI